MIYASGMLTTACALVLAAHQLEELKATASSQRKETAPQPESEPQDLGIAERLAELIETWTGVKREAGSPSTWIKGVLEKGLIRYAYPMINRLHMLRLLIESTVLSSKKETWSEDKELLAAQVDELLALSEQFAAPLHFTPIHPGVSCALLYLRCRVEAGEDCSTFRPRLRKSV
jgi:hypothetical protein